MFTYYIPLLDVYKTYYFIKGSEKSCIRETYLTSLPQMHLTSASFFKLYLTMAEGPTIPQNILWEPLLQTNFLLWTPIKSPVFGVSFCQDTVR